MTPPLPWNTSNTLNPGGRRQEDRHQHYRGNPYGAEAEVEDGAAAPQGAWPPGNVKYSLFGSDRSPRRGDLVHVYVCVSVCVSVRMSVRVSMCPLLSSKGH